MYITKSYGELIFRVVARCDAEMLVMIFPIFLIFSLLSFMPAAAQGKVGVAFSPLNSV